MPGINPQGYGPIPQAPPGSQMNWGHLSQALWNALKVIGTPNKNSAVGGLLGSVANQGKNPMNLAMLLAGGPEGSPLTKSSWLEPYNMPKAMSGGHVAFREGQPWDVHNSIGLAKGRGGILKENPNDPQVRQALMQAIHDALFGGTTHMTSGNSIPPRP